MCWRRYDAASNWQRALSDDPALLYKKLHTLFTDHYEEIKTWDDCAVAANHCSWLDSLLHADCFVGRCDVWASGYKIWDLPQKPFELGKVFRCTQFEVSLSKEKVDVGPSHDFAVFSPMGYDEDILDALGGHVIWHYNSDAANIYEDFGVFMAKAKGKKTVTVTMLAYLEMLGAFTGLSRDQIELLRDPVIPTVLGYTVVRHRFADDVDD
jgi:hypothetical protein